MNEMGVVEPNLVEPSPYIRVISFLHNVWNHPLLTEATIQHRRQFPDKFKEWCNVWGIDSQKLVAVPVASTLWIVDEQGKSDHDFIFYGFKKDIQPYVDQLPLLLRAHKVDDKRLEVEGDIHPVESLIEPYFLSDSQLVSLLLTPDNFVGGNIKLAAQYRMHILHIYNQQSKAIREYFDREIKGWSTKTSPAKTGESRKRIVRFEKTLDKRATDLEIRTGFSQEEYKKRFSQMLQDIEPPPFSVFTSAIQHTQGKLLLPESLGKKITRL